MAWDIGERPGEAVDVYEYCPRERSPRIKARLLACFGALILGIVLSACSSSGPKSTTQEPTYAAPDPIDVKVTLDAKLASKGVLTSAGGKISARGSDGTRFTLTLPKGALRDSERITLTPVSSAAGLPFSGGLAGAVQMAPEGLRLLAPGSLLIESPKVIAAKGFETVAFAYHKDGEGLYLDPSETKDGALTIELWHFSGAGAAQGTPAEIQTQQTQHVPSNAEDAFRQRVRAYLGPERQAQLMGGNVDPDQQSTLHGFLREAYDRFIGPELPIALEDCNRAPAIMSKALGWARQVQLMANKDSAQGAELQALAEGIINTYEKVKIKCWRAYKAVGNYGQAGPLSGVVGDLTKPFTLTCSGSGGFTASFHFTPSSRESGTWTMTADLTHGATSKAGGTYTVQGADSESPRILTRGRGVTTAPAGRVEYAHNVPFQLEQLE